MLLIIAIVFCHSFVRFILAIARGSSVHVRNRILSRMGTGGYAEPDRPIPVVLAADEEIMAESNGASPTTQEKLTAPPPAYGLWRSSVVSVVSSSSGIGSAKMVFLTWRVTEDQPRPALLATCRRCISGSKKYQRQTDRTTTPKLCIG